MKTFKEIHEVSLAFAKSNPDATIADAYRQGMIDAFRLKEPVMVTDEPSFFAEPSSVPAPSKPISAKQSSPSFDDFWNAYKYKVGKNTAEKAWRKLSNAEKFSAVGRIPVYNKFLEVTGISKKHPSTYLNQKSWTDDFESIIAEKQSRVQKPAKPSVYATDKEIEENHRRIEQQNAEAKKNAISWEQYLINKKNRESQQNNNSK